MCLRSSGGLVVVTVLRRDSGKLPSGAPKCDSGVRSGTRWCDAVCVNCWNPTFLMLHGKWRISHSPWVGIAEQFQGESSYLLGQLADCLHTVHLHHPVLGDHEAAAETDFGQSDFGHPCWPTLAKPTLAQIGVSVIWRPRSLGPRRVGEPEGWVPQNFALFLPFPITASLSLCLSGCLLVEFGGV